VSSTLFRQEVLSAHSAQYLGGIRIGRNPRHATVAAVSLLLAGALLAFGTWGQVTRKARIPGLLVPALGTLQLSASAVGTVVQRNVAEGDFVQAGQVLFVLGTDRTGARGDTAVLIGQNLLRRRQTLESERGLRQQQARQRLQALADRTGALERESMQAETEAQFAERRVTLAAKSV
jgi:membrane fusion protein